MHSRGGSGHRQPGRLPQRGAHGSQEDGWRRLRGEALQDQRLAEADGEIGFAKDSGYYQYFITNDILKGSVDRVLEIIEQETKTA